MPAKANKQISDQPKPLKVHIFKCNWLHCILIRAPCIFYLYTLSLAGSSKLWNKTRTVYRGVLNVSGQVKLWACVEYRDCSGEWSRLSTCSSSSTCPTGLFKKLKAYTATSQRGKCTQIRTHAHKATHIVKVVIRSYLRVLELSHLNTCL